MAIMLAPFDASREFTAAAPFRCSGVLVSKDAPFDKRLANDRLLRQLYEGRRIVYADQPAKDGRSTKRLRRLLSGLTESVRVHLTKASQIDEGSSDAQLPAAEGGEGGLSKDSEHQSEVAASDQAASQQTSVDAEAVDASPDSTDAAAAPDGEAETAAATDPRDAKIDEMMIAHSQSALLEKAVAAEIGGVSKRTPKAELAAALVDAGHA